jgi:hypothetical protein
MTKGMKAMATAISDARVASTMRSASRTEKVFVTPEMAAEWLALNHGNRNLVRGHVASLENVLRRGEWALNGETIKFALSGRLLDGQHRLTACVNSNVGFWTYVVHGLDESSFDTIDTTARPRKVSDILGINGKQNCTTLGACVKTLWVFGQSGQFYDGGHHGAFTPRVCVDVLSRRPAIESFVLLARNNPVFGSQSLLAALGYLFSCVDDALASEFLGVMNDGSSEMLRPFNILREALINRRMTSVRLGNRPLAFMSIRAWNAEMSGDWIKKVYYKPTEDFPAIAGIDYERLSQYV